VTYYLHSAIILSTIQLAWANTPGQHLRPLRRNKWCKGEDHKTPSWYHGPPRCGKGCHYGDASCHRNGTQSGGIDVELHDDEQMLWASPNGMCHKPSPVGIETGVFQERKLTENPDPNVAVVSVTITPYPGERILDMERFSDGIAHANCSENMIITFSQRSIFERARRAWVNQGGG
jgi:hypothetical protein